MDLLSELQHAEFKEAFDEFDKVRLWLSYVYSKWILKEVHASLRCMVLRYYSVLLPYSFSVCEQAEKLEVYLTMLLLLIRWVQA